MAAAQAPPSPAPATPAPENLNPSDNRLDLPTKPEQVQVEQVQPITLQQALDLAQRNNRPLQNAVLTRDRSRAAVREATAADYPTFGLQSNLTRSDSASGELSIRERGQLPPELGSAFDSSGVSTTFDSSIELNYEIFTSGRRSANIQAAREQLRFDELEVERLSRQTRLDVSEAYYNLQQADAQVEIAEAAVREADRSVRDAQLLEQAGLGTKFDILQAQVQLAQANQDLTNARSQQRIARRQLVQLLSLANTVEVAAADPIQPLGNWSLPLEQSIVLAFSNRAELQQQLARRNISEQQRRVALAAVRPQVSVFANYNVLDDLDDRFGFADGLSLGARLRWDFFDGGAARSRARQEEINRSIAETDFADNRDRIRFEVEQAFFNLNSSQQNIQTATSAVEQAEESLRLARLRFNEGVGTQTDVINEQTALTRARVNRLQAILDYNRAFSALQRAVSNSQ
ncbi:MAG: TolC family protein [Cyanosarcina radialis HA8281-LM2]|nr:TolC family protein [Cyanosarcina radialis HA8281-LM2]